MKVQCPWMIFLSTHKNHWNENPNEREIVIVKESKERTVKRRNVRIWNKFEFEFLFFFVCHYIHICSMVLSMLLGFSEFFQFIPLKLSEICTSKDLQIYESNSYWEWIYLRCLLLLMFNKVLWFSNIYSFFCHISDVYLTLCMLTYYKLLQEKYFKMLLEK